MSSKTTSKDKSPGRKDRAAKKKLKKASRRGREAPTEGRAPMQPDPSQHQPAADPQDGAAVIHPVTDAALDHAAQRAAELADAVAHHTATPEHHDASPDPQAGSQAPSEAEPQSEGSITPVTEVQEVAAQAAEATIAVARDATADIEQHSGETAATVQRTVTQATESALGGAAATLALYNTKVLDMVQANLAASTALFSALSQAKSLPEAVAINADHLSRQFEALTTQGRELASLAQSLTVEALKPLGGLARRGP